MRKFIYAFLVSILFLPISALANGASCCNPLPCSPTQFYYPGSCCTHFYVKPAYTLSKRETVNERNNPSGGAISFGFIQPWTEILSWGLEAGWGSYGNDEFITNQNLTTQTTVKNADDVVLSDITTTNTVSTKQTLRYYAYDFAGLLYLHWRQLSVFGKAGFANVYLHNTGNQVGNSFTNTTASETADTTTTIKTDGVTIESVNNRISDVTPLAGIGFDYLFRPNLATGVELIHFAGTNRIDPMDSVQFYVRLTT